MSQQHSRAFVYMNSAIWSPEGFVVISGEIGSGKTTLLKKTIRSLDGNLKLLHVSYTNLKSEDFFRLLVHQAGIKVETDSKVTMLFAIMDYLQMMADRGTPVVLAVDEAQNLSKENLEDIRMLAGLEGLGGPAMRVILLGQPELKEHIQKIQQLAQRVKLFFHLEGLSLKETGEYIDYRLLVAGHKGAPLFDEAMVKDIFTMSHGIPRVINKLCDGLMMCAFAEERHVLNRRDLEEIRKDLLGDYQEGGAPNKPTIPTSTSSSDFEVSTPPTSSFEGGELSSTLSRIADALEGIDRKIGMLLHDKTGTPPPQDSGNVKPLSPGRHRNN
ncbi:ExeA family protein [Marinobacter daqiaonensis]|nr:AAA family ATPase [Marinobacter daqiaonensis]